MLTVAYGTDSAKSILRFRYRSCDDFPLLSQVIRWGFPRVNSALSIKTVLVLLLLAVAHRLFSHLISLKDTRAQGLLISLEPLKNLLGPRDAVPPWDGLSNRRIAQNLD